MTSRDEALRTLEKKPMDALARVESIKRHLSSVGAHDDYIEHCDAISAAILSARQEVAPVGPEVHREAASIDAVVHGTGFLVDGKHVAPCRVEMIQGRFTSPAQTSEARDAARYRWLRDTPGIQTFICGFAGHSRISGVHADVEIDAAMRQEVE